MHLQRVIKFPLKTGVLLCSHLMSDRLFNVFFNFSLNIYKCLIRYSYYALGLIYFVLGMHNKYQMVRSIYKVLPYTMVGISGLEATYKLTKYINEKSIEGDVLELGVAKGGCAALIASIIFDSNNTNNIERKLWLFDSFEGLPDPTEEDYINNRTGKHIRPLSRGACCGTLEEVKHLLFDIFNFPKDRVIFVKGWFENTIPVEREKIVNIALLRIDGDWYSSTKCCMEGLYSKVKKGGAIIVDDYESCYGCKKAIDEFLFQNNLNHNIILDGRGGCYFEK